MSNWSHWWGLPFIYSRRHSLGALYFATEVALASKKKKEREKITLLQSKNSPQPSHSHVWQGELFLKLDKTLPNNNQKHLKMTVVCDFFFLFKKKKSAVLGFSRKPGLTGNGGVVNFNCEWDQNSTNHQTPDVGIWWTIENHQIFYNWLQFS